MGDCILMLRGLPSGSVDLIIADPPYYRMRGGFDFVFHSEREYLEWCAEWVKECYRVLKPTGAFYCWGSSLMIDRISVEVLSRFEWIKRNLIVWNYCLIIKKLYNLIKKRDIEIKKLYNKKQRGE